MHYDLRDSETEDGQRMPNVLLPDAKLAIYRHVDISEVVVCVLRLSHLIFMTTKAKKWE